MSPCAYRSASPGTGAGKPEALRAAARLAFFSCMRAATHWSQSWLEGLVSLGRIRRFSTNDRRWQNCAKSDTGPELSGRAPGESSSKTSLPWKKAVRPLAMALISASLYG